MAHPLTLADFAGPCKPSGQHVCYQHCPVCGSDEWKLYVALDTGLWKCFAGRHNGGGKVDVGQADNPYTQGQELMDLLDGWQEPVAWDEVELPEWEPLTKMAKRYLMRRDIDEGLRRRLGLVERVDKPFRILIPYFDRAGNMVYWNSRRYSKDIGSGPKYLTAPGKHPLYEQRHPVAAASLSLFHEKAEGEVDPDWVLETGNSTAVLVEGVFDSWAVAQAGYHAIALGGKSLPAYLANDLLTLTQQSAIIVVMLDSDALAAALQIRDQISHKREVRIVPCPPGRDPGDMSPEEIRRMIHGDLDADSQ